MQTVHLLSTYMSDFMDYVYGTSNYWTLQLVGTYYYYYYSAVFQIKISDLIDIWRTPPVGGHLQLADTSNRRTPPIGGHLQSADTSNRRTPPIGGHFFAANQLFPLILTSGHFQFRTKNITPMDIIYLFLFFI